MGLRKPVALFTVDDYLYFERCSSDRHIYLDGSVIAMAGESPAHADISANILGSLVVQLKGRPYRARTKDTKIRSGIIPERGTGTSGMFSYPDIVAVCGEPEYHDASRDVILNPTSVIEVLSPSTEEFDRGEKFERYQLWNPTLRDYVLVSQFEPLVEHFQRQADGSFKLVELRGLDAVLELTSIGCRLALADIYDRVTFNPK